MAWWNHINEYLSRADITKTELPQKPKNRAETLKRAAMMEAIYWFYFLLGFFTQLYFWTTAFFFFFRQSAYYSSSSELLSALSEPYLGAVGVYVILKEIRKQKINRQSRHYGEMHVWFWLGLLLVGGFLVILTKEYRFDTLMKLVITNSLASLILYIAGKLHKP